jgi:hypothetical protein
VWKDVDGGEKVKVRLFTLCKYMQHNEGEMKKIIRKCQCEGILLFFHLKCKKKEEEILA